VRDNVFSFSVGNELHNKGGKHPAIFPESLARDHILSWSNPGDLVLDPFVGSGTTPKMAMQNGRHYLGFDISEEYCTLARKRVAWANPPLLVVS
jgi:site-specific DNA-methyltransferase (adenine-specific)